MESLRVFIALMKSESSEQGMCYTSLYSKALKVNN